MGVSPRLSAVPQELVLAKPHSWKTDIVVGNALRRNPFAPVVPCHRVIANNLFLGGFQGVWDLNGATAPKKLALLKSEGVTFDSRGIITDTRLVFDEFQVHKTE